MKKTDAFLHNLLLFGRLLRGLGMDVNPSRMIDLVQALEYINLAYKMDFYYAMRGFLVHDRHDIPLFDQAFELFWQKPIDQWSALEFESIFTQKRTSPKLVTPSLQVIEPEQDSGQDGPESESDSPPLIEVTMTYSTKEILRQKDFGDLTGEEIEEIKKQMQQLALRLGERITRRRRAGKRGQLDLRRSMRKSFKHGGEILQWARRDRKTKPRPIIIIADISGSMERYTRLLLYFIYALAQDRHHPVEAFVFSTRLTRITRQLASRDVETALSEVSNVVHDWSGGTRTGESLKMFNYKWGRRVLGRGAVVLIISDGWDRGDTELLDKEMARLQRSCYRTIWLNPLLGSDEYEPLTRGIKTALPYVDDFLPVHNLASLEDLATHLGKIGVR